jgi:hypothetical protein
MKIFILSPFVLAKIKTVIDAYFTAAGITKKDVLYLDYEPDQGYVLSQERDGVVAVYGRTIAFSESSGSATGTQETDSTLVVDCYGIGDPINTTVEGENFAFDSSVREATRRGQLLMTLAYRAIMDRQEVAGSKTVPKWYDSNLAIQARYPKTFTKGSPIGNMETRRGVCVFRSEYKFVITEDVPSEALGEEYAGISSFENETTYPE